MPKRLKKLSEEVLHENPWWKYKHDRYILPNGKEGDYYYAETPGVCMIIPVLEDGRVVLTLQHRYLEDKQSIEFPAGGMKGEKDTALAAQQELLEETGYNIESMSKLAQFQPASGFVKDTTHVFLAYVTDQQQQQLDDSEDIELLYRKPAEIDEMIHSGDVWCGQTIAAWFLARNHLL